MTLDRALAVLHATFAGDERVHGAFLRAAALRNASALADPLGYLDVPLCAGGLLPPASEMTLEVDLMRRPKQGGGVRVERVCDVFTGTLLECVADVVCEGRRPWHDGPSTAFGQGPCGGSVSYEAWAAGLVRWLAVELAAGRTVVATDFEGFFSAIRESQLDRALRASGVSEPVTRATLGIFSAMNSAGSATPARGMPVMPDRLAWVLADAVLDAFDADLQQDPRVRAYARWIDDCFVSCAGDKVDETLGHVASVAAHHGFRLNAAKTVVIDGPQSLDAALLQREHGVLDEIAALVQRRIPAEEPLRRFLAEGRGRLTRGQSASTRVVMRLYALGARAQFMELVECSDRDLDAFPAAERAILGYLAAMRWPRESMRTLLRVLDASDQDSRLLFALGLVLQTGTDRLDAEVVARCHAIAGAGTEVHDVARALALAIVVLHEGRPAFARQWLTTGSRPRSALARRIALAAWAACDACPSSDIGWALREENAVARRLASIASDSRSRERLAMALSDSPRNGGNALREMLRGRFAAVSR